MAQLVFITLIYLRSHLKIDKIFRISEHTTWNKTKSRHYFISVTITQYEKDAKLLRYALTLLYSVPVITFQKPCRIRVVLVHSEHCG